MNGLENIKVGDYIHYRVSYGGDKEVVKVERLTKTHAVCTRDTKFMISTGKMVGRNGHDVRYGYKSTTEEIVAILFGMRLKKAAMALPNLKITAGNLESIELLLEDQQLIEKVKP